MSRKMKNNAAAYVQDHFGMELFKFIKLKVEAESLHDYEIAKILNVQASYVGRLRRSFGIKKADGFPRRFERRYGLGAVETFKKIVENPDKSLSDAARHFGFSRQNAWQVYTKIFKRPYKEAHERKRLKRSKEH
jgi:hypothetical protein